VYGIALLFAGILVIANVPYLGLPMIAIGAWLIVK
jgi:hypothetical protein